MFSYIFRGLKANINKKKWFGIFFDDRDKIKNWLYLYLITSSLILDFIALFSRYSDFIANLKIKAKYVNGMELFFPLITSRYYGMFTDIVADQYCNDFKKYFNEELSLHEGDVVFDIGAHIGKFSVPILRNFPHVRIFSVEPDPVNFDCLKKNLEHNCPENNSYKLYRGIVFDDTSSKAFSLGTYSTQGSVKSVGFDYASEDANIISVRSYMLSELFEENEIERCALLKMDCEGSEYAIFESLPDHILRKVGIIFIEAHKIKDRSPQLLKRFLEERGFDVRGHERPDGGWEFFCVNKQRVAA